MHVVLFWQVTVIRERRLQDGSDPIVAALRAQPAIRIVEFDPASYATLSLIDAQVRIRIVVATVHLNNQCVLN